MGAEKLKNEKMPLSGLGGSSSKDGTYRITVVDSVAWYIFGDGLSSSLASDMCVRHSGMPRVTLTHNATQAALSFVNLHNLCIFVIASLALLVNVYLQKNL